MFRSSHFLFLVFVTFGNQVTKILRNLCLHFVRQDGQDKKKGKENHTTKVTKIPKTKRQIYGMNETCITKYLTAAHCKQRHLWMSPAHSMAARRPSSSLKWPRNGDGGKWKCDLSRGLYAFLQSHQTKGSKSDPALSSYLRWSLKLQHPLILPIPPLCFISQILNCITCSI